MSVDNNCILSTCMSHPSDIGARPSGNLSEIIILESSVTMTLDGQIVEIKETESVQQGEVEKPISKSKQKKLLKKERWQTMKAERSKFIKERKKERKRALRESGVDMGPSKKLLKKNTMKNSTCKVQVAIDCSFDELMADRDINKLGQQIQYCYSGNRRASQPLQLYLTSLGGKTRERLDRIGDYRGWDIHIKNNSYLEEFTKESIVYLTSDSPNVLDALDPEKVYIIGGLVDHNHHKGLCFDTAQKYGVGHAQLPIGEYVQLSSRKVLTVNHVFEILLNFTETQSWKESFYRVIPRRKQVGESRHERRLKKKADAEEHSSNSSGENDDESTDNERVKLESECKRSKSDSDDERSKSTSGKECAELISESNRKIEESSDSKISNITSEPITDVTDQIEVKLNY